MSIKKALRSVGVMVATVSMVVVGLTVGAGAASAHTGDLDVTAVCNTDTGQYDFTANLALTKSKLGATTNWKIGTSDFEGTPTSAAGLDKGPITSPGNTTFELGTWSMPGDTTGFGPWVYGFTTWTDGLAKGSDGQLLARLAGDCSVPDVKDATAAVQVEPPTCLANGSVAYTARFATLVGTLNQTPGSMRFAHFKSMAGHLFDNGTDNTNTGYTVGARTVGADCAGDQPPANVGHQDVDSAPICLAEGGGTVTTEHQSRTQPYVLEGSKWVPGEWSAWTTDSTTERAATAEECPAPPVKCYDFQDQKMWEVSWGQSFENRGDTATFTIDSNGGLVGLDGGSVPAYMTAKPGWHWLYVTDGANNDHTYTFADGTVRTVTVTINKVEDGCNTATITWGEQAPAVVVVPVNPTATSGKCDLETGNVPFMHVTVPADSEGITYLMGEITRDGSTDSATVTATLVKGHAFGELPKGWVLQENGTATFLVTASVPKCETPPVIIKVVPVIPTVTAGICTADGQPGLMMVGVVDHNPNGLTYKVSKTVRKNGTDTATATATLNKGYTFGTLPKGWVLQANGTATFKATAHAPVCVIKVIPVQPTVTQGFCSADGQAGLMMVGIVDHNPNGLRYSVSRTVRKNGVDSATVTATLNKGYTFGTLPRGWVLQKNGTATYLATAKAPKCVKTPPVVTPPVTPPPVVVPPVVKPPVVSPVVPPVVTPAPVTKPISKAPVAVQSSTTSAAPAPVTETWKPLPGATGDGLAYTGVSSGTTIGMSIAGLLLLLLGAGLIVAGRRRKGQH